VLCSNQIQQNQNTNFTFDRLRRKGEGNGGPAEVERATLSSKGESLGPIHCGRKERGGTLRKTELRRGKATGQETSPAIFKWQNGECISGTK